MAALQREERGEDDGARKRSKWQRDRDDIILVIDHHSKQTRSSLCSTATSLPLKIWCTIYSFQMLSLSFCGVFSTCASVAPDIISATISKEL